MQRVLKEAGVEVGDFISVTNEGVTYEGILIPRSEYEDEKRITVKLKSGYNIGVLVTPKTNVKKIGAGVKPKFVQPKLSKQKPSLLKVAIVSTGGTIASRVDYRTGGVRPALSARDLYSVVPELSEIARMDAEILFSLFSENITPKHWSEMAVTIASHINRGVAGVVVAHGTDTLAYTAAALSFALGNLPIPIILVGSQRSADRPSSDAAINLIGAVTAAAKAPFAEVVLAMHETTSDKSVIFHRGTKVRKCHTSRRDAFKSINFTPIARMEGDKIMMMIDEYRRRDTSRNMLLKPDFEEKVALIKSYPGFDPLVVDWYINNGYKGIIFEGTGLGHVSENCFSVIKKAIENNVVIAMTSQCIWGRVNMNVYDTGRDLLAMGVIPLEDMLPETAMVKLMWILGSLKPKNIHDVERLMFNNFSGELNPRSLPVES